MSAAVAEDAAVLRQIFSETISSTTSAAAPLANSEILADASGSRGKPIPADLTLPAAASAAEAVSS